MFNKKKKSMSRMVWFDELKTRETRMEPYCVNIYFLTYFWWSRWNKVDHISSTLWKTGEPRYSWNTTKGGVKHQIINQSIIILW